MARPAEYDLNEVLDNAMNIFWQKGYAGVSMSELVAYTKLNRRTMYSLFKDKEGLFRDALEHYYLKLVKCKLTVLKENPGKKGIEMFFESFCFSDKFKGCLFSNSIHEKVFLQTNTFDISKQYFENLRLGIEENLAQAVQKGEFSGDPRAMSLTLITVIHGFHVYGKYNHSKEDSDAIFKNILSMIR